MTFVCMVCRESDGAVCGTPTTLDSAANDANAHAYAYVGSEATAK
jgi:hypothetical protein